MAGNVMIRPVGADERAAWEPLWNGYLAFYKATLAPGASASVPISLNRAEFRITPALGEMVVPLENFSRREVLLLPVED